MPAIPDRFYLWDIQGPEIDAWELENPWYTGIGVTLEQWRPRWYWRALKAVGGAWLTWRHVT